MALNLNAVSVFDNGGVVPTAPLIEGAAAATLTTNSNGNIYHAGSTAGRFGMRVTLPSVADFTTHDFISFSLFSDDFTPGQNAGNVAAGGWRAVFVDSSGNYAGFNIYGGDIPDALYNQTDGYFVDFQLTLVMWHIAPSHAPAIASATPVNWASIAAVEITSLSTGAPTSKGAQLRRLCKRNAPSITGTQTFAELPALAGAADNLIVDGRLIGRPQRQQYGTPQIAYSMRIGFTIGDGTTATHVSESNFALGFEVTYDKSPAFVCVGPYIQLSSSNARPLTVNQSASCTLALSDGVIGSAAYWSWVLQGSGTATLDRMQFWRFNGFTAAHGTYTDCAWNGGEAPVEVTASTHIVRGAIRNASHGVKINSAPGNYAALEVALDSNSTYDVQVGSGGAGTYTLTGVSVLDSAYTLKLHNDSATNAVVVELPAGILYSTSTAGGAITVSAPSTFIDASVTAIEPGSRLLVVNETTGVTITNEVIAGASWSSSTALGVDYTPGDIVRVDATFCDGATAKLPFRARAVVGATAWSVLAAQEDDAVYNANAVDGSTVTEFTADYPHVQIDINDLDGNTTPQRGYAWYCYAITSEAGIVAYFGAMTAEDEFNYVIETDVADVKLQNVGTGSVSITGAAIRRRDGTSPIATDSGSVHLWAGRVYGLETGVSGLTGTESEMLSQAANAGNLSFSGGAVNANVAKFAGATITGAGVSTDPFKPA